MHAVGIIGLGTVGARFVEQFGLNLNFTVSAAWCTSPFRRPPIAHTSDWR